MNHINHDDDFLTKDFLFLFFGLLSLALLLILLHYIGNSNQRYRTMIAVAKG